MNKKSLKKTLLVGISSVLTLASVIGLTAQPALADDCLKADPTVTLTSPATQQASAGSTITYTMDVTNNDSAGCLTSDFSFAPVNIPYGWDATTTPNSPVTVSPLQTVSVSVAYSSPGFATGGAYSLTFATTKHYNDVVLTEDTVVYTYLTYKVLSSTYQDVTAPVVNILSPNNGDVFRRNTTVVIQAQATDNVGVARLYYRVNDETICMGAEVTSCSWTPTKRGTYLIMVTAYDAAGNTTSRSVSVTVK